METIDDDLVVALGAGSPAERRKATSVLAERYGPLMLKSTRKMLEGHHVPFRAIEQHLDDVFQEVWLEFAEVAEQGVLTSRTPEQRVGYLFGVMRNVVKTLIRGNVRYRRRFENEEQAVAEAESTVSDAGALTVLVNDVQECLQRLSKQEQAVVEARLGLFQNIIPTKELASILKIADATLRGYLASGKEKLMACMRVKGHGPILGRTGEK